jgi:hypothetical protein
MAERDSGQPESAESPGPPGREVGATSFLQRAVIRRRVRFLHRRRELALYDLGGFLFESHRLGQPHEEILAEKLEALTVLDDELALLQRALDLHEEVAVLSEPGIAACSHCGTLRDSAANFCPGCGRPASETLPLAAEPAATAAVTTEGVLALAPDSAAETAAADLSAGHETEIEAAAAAQEPPAPPSPDETAEMPAVRLVPVNDADFASWQADEPADGAELPATPPQEPAEEAGVPAWEADEPDEDAEPATPEPEELAEETGLPAWHSHEQAEEAGLPTAPPQEPAAESDLATRPHEPAVAPAEGADGRAQAEETSAAAADPPS